MLDSAGWWLRRIDACRHAEQRAQRSSAALVCGGEESEVAACAPVRPQNMKQETAQRTHERKQS